MKWLRLCVLVLIGLGIFVLAAKERRDRAVTRELELSAQQIREDVRKGTILADREHVLKREIHELGLRRAELEKIISREQYRLARTQWPAHPCLQRRWK